MNNRETILQYAESRYPAYREIALRIHANPETSNHENFACGLLSETLKKEGFEVTVNVAGHPTGFTGVYRSGKPGPVLAFTISSALSGSYNSACTARTMLQEEDPGKQIAVIDSKATGPEVSMLITKARELILDPDNTIYYSTVSVWEVLLKHVRHPENIPFDEAAFSEGCREAGFVPLGLADKHILAVHTLAGPETVPAQRRTS